MCLPAVIPLLTAVGGGSAIAGAATVAGLAGTAASAVSSIQQGKFQKGVAKYNAQVARNTATQTRNQGVEAEVAKRQQTKQLISQQRAALGASGVELDSGSALQLQEDAERIGEVDALRIRSNFSRRADSIDQSAVLESRQGDFAQRAGFNRAASTAITGASSFASKWYDNNKV